MFAMQARRTEPRSITKRRETEAYYNSFEGVRAEDRKYAQIANWEINSQKMIDRNIVANIARGIESNEQKKLEVRQKRLAALYQADEEAQKKELASLRETSAQKAKRMVTQARKLKAAREEKRRLFAQEMYNRQWREGCDDLRLIGSERFARHCREEIAEQRVEKAQRKYHEQRKEKDWANIWENERQKRVQKEEELKRRRQRFNHETKMTLLDQMEHSRQEGLKKVYEKEMEREAFAKQLSEDTAYAKEAQVRAAKQRREAMQDILDFNEKAQATKAEIARAQREQELRDLNEKMEVVRQDNARKQEEARQRARDMQKYMSYVKQYKEEDAAIERTIEQLSLEEMQRANSKKDAQWQREQQQREALMADVYHGRAVQLNELEQKRSDLEKELELERRLVAEEATKAQALEEKEEEEWRRKNLTTQADLLRQMQEKRNDEKIKESLIVEERENSIAAERQYRAFVARERAAGLAIGAQIPASRFA